MILHTAAAQWYACVTIAEAKVACASPKSPSPLARGERVVRSQVYFPYVLMVLALYFPIWVIQGNEVSPGQQH